MDRGRYGGTGTLAGARLARRSPRRRAELRNVVERLLLLAMKDAVDVATVHAALPQASVMAAPAALPGAGTLTTRVEAFERETILAKLRRHQNHITHAAHALGMERSYLYKKCQQLGIDLRALRRGKMPPA